MEKKRNENSWNNFEEGAKLKGSHERQYGTGGQSDKGGRSEDRGQRWKPTLMQ